MARVVPADWGGEAALLPWLVDDLAGALAHLRRPLLIDVHEEAVPWEGVARVASAFPLLPVVLGGGSRTEAAIARALCRACPNVLVETSWLDRRGVEQMIGTIGARRVVFGSGRAYPDDDEALAPVAGADCTPEELELVLSRNAEQLLAGSWRA
jgi:predicted TIM-barrel fold metal-dependent hydrolase